MMMSIRRFAILFASVCGNLPHNATGLLSNSQHIHASSKLTHTHAHTYTYTYTQSISPIRPARSSHIVPLLAQNNPNDESSMLTRFTSPKIADPGLPLADALIAQIVAPSLQVFWLVSQAAPSPTWLQPLFPTSQLLTTRGSLVAPTLIHGAGLASCWLLAALAAKAYEREGFDISEENGSSYAEVLWRLVQAGAFAVGLLILSTQFDLFWEFGGKFVQYGDGEDSNLRILTAAVEVINDCFFEGIALGSWRLYRASLTKDGIDWS